jgi:hypothetical protein
MKTFTTVVCLFILAATSIYGQKNSVARTMQILKNREPKVKWNLHSLLKADFDYDGIADYALTGRKDNFFVIGIVKGVLTNNSKHWTLEFSENAGSQNALCSVAKARISLEPFSNDDEIADVQKLPKKSRGINLSDESCDAFHIYYNRKENQFDWWRR